jgi:hypothetical protein
MRIIEVLAIIGISSLVVVYVKLLCIWIEKGYLND